MIYIRPTQSGYGAYDLYHEKLYSEDNCEKLFSFVESDTARIKELLCSYFEAIIDVESLTIKGKQPAKKLVEGIKKEMKRIHPFLVSDEYVTVFRMLAEHLNLELVRLNTPLMPIEVYADLFRQVLNPLYMTTDPWIPATFDPINDHFVEYYYKELLSMYNGSVRAAGLDYLEEVRNEAERYIYWVLDRSSFRFRSFDKETRIRLYSRIFREGIISPDIRTEYACYWVKPEGYDYYMQAVAATQATDDITSGDPLVGQTPEEIVNQARTQGKEDNPDVLRRMDTLARLKMVTNDRHEFTQDMKDFMNDGTDAVCDDTTPTMLEEFRVDSFEQLIQMQLWLLTKAELLIKRCRYCDRLFIAERLSSDYCNRIKDGETEPCDVVGPKKSFARLMEEDHILKVYNRVYKTIYARKKRGSISDAEFIEWKTEARSLLDKTRAGGMSEEDFEAWLTQDVRAWGAFGKEE